MTTYADVVNIYGVAWCQACPLGNHDKGWADMSRGIVHWRERRLERRGLRIFLKLVASIKFSHNRGQPLWQQLYEQNAWAFHEALDHFGVRLRSSYADLDRAYARYDARDEQVSVTNPGAYRWMNKKED